MNRIDSLNIYLSDKRKYILIMLNIVLVIFIFLEVLTLNTINPDKGNIESLPKYASDGKEEI